MPFPPPTEEQWLHIGEAVARGIASLPEVLTATYNPASRSVDVVLAPNLTDFPLTIVVGGDEEP